MLLNRIAMGAGVFFFLFGILGFFPGLLSEDQLFDLFRINAERNALMIITGVISFWVSFKKPHNPKVFFQVFGIVFTVLGVLGFGYHEQEVFGLIANNMANSWFNLAVGLIGLYLGFGHPHKLGRR